MKDYCAVSIILPTYNRVNYLRPAVESILAQTFTDWELIIADDGSDAETLAYLGELAENQQVKVLYLEHTGNPSAVRNVAIRASRSDYIAFMDSDDLWLPTKLAAHVALHQVNPTRRWNYTALLRIDADGRTMPTEFPGRRSVREGAIFTQLLTFAVAMTPTCLFAERSLVEEIGGFDETQLYFEDYDLLLRLSLRSEAGAIPQQLAQVRNHTEHYSGDRARVYECRFRLLDKNCRRDGHHGRASRHCARRAGKKCPSPRARVCRDRTAERCPGRNLERQRRGRQPGLVAKGRLDRRPGRRTTKGHPGRPHAAALDRVRTKRSVNALQPCGSTPPGAASRATDRRQFRSIPLSQRRRGLRGIGQHCPQSSRS